MADCLVIFESVINSGGSCTHRWSFSLTRSMFSRASCPRSVIHTFLPFMHSILTLPLYVVIVTGPARKNISLSALPDQISTRQQSTSYGVSYKQTGSGWAYTISESAYSLSLATAMLTNPTCSIGGVKCRIIFDDQLISVIRRPSWRIVGMPTTQTWGVGRAWLLLRSCPLSQRGARWIVHSSSRFGKTIRGCPRAIFRNHCGPSGQQATDACKTACAYWAADGETHHKTLYTVKYSKGAQSYGFALCTCYYCGTATFTW